MQRKKDEPLTPALSREICERNNAQAMLHGTIAKLGSRYVLILDADSCVNGKQIAGYKAEAASKEAVLGALDEAAGHVRKQLGESSASLEKFQTPVAQATTPSLDALRAYSQASERFQHGDFKAAQSLLERAIAQDPNFASAYRSLSSTYYNRGDFAQAAKFIQKAFELRDRTTERERLGIETAYYAYGVYDYEATIRSMKLFNEIYPNNAGNWGNLCNMYTQLGEYTEAIAAGEQSYRIDPHLAIGGTVLARAYKRANRFADAKRVANTVIAEGKDQWGIHSILFQIAFAEHDAAKIKSEGEWGLTHLSANQSLDDLAFAAATGGRLHEAVDDFTRSKAESLRGGDTDFANEVLMDQAGVQVRLEEFAGAKETLSHLEDAGGLSADGGMQAALAAYRAQLGDPAFAQHLLATSGNGDDKNNTVLVFVELPVLRALLALKAHKPAEAVQLLEPTRPYQLRDFVVPYLRAQAEAEAGMLDAAAADYRMILDNQGVDPISPMYPLSHLRLARVLALEKKTDESRSQYRAFFDAWGDADQGIKILADAKREYAQLQ
jgi:tetratricopeptide (TPR) repeat protein